MAADANVLIYERVREELRLGNSPQSAIHAGFDKAFSAIADSNITTLIAGIVLFAFGTGPIKGFAVTLMIGIAHVAVYRDPRQPRADPVDLGSASQADGAAGLTIRNRFKSTPAWNFSSKTPTHPVHGEAQMGYAISAVLIIGSFALLATRGLNFGIDFTGGVVLEVELPAGVDHRSCARERLEAAGFDVQRAAQTVGSSQETHGSRAAEGRPGLEPNEVRTRSWQALQKRGSQVATAQSADVVGPQVGEELTEQGGLAMLFTFIMILIYVGFRFEMEDGGRAPSWRPCTIRS